MVSSEADGAVRDQGAQAPQNGIDASFILYFITIGFILFPWALIGPTFVGGGTFFEYRGASYILVLLTTLVFLSNRETFESKKTGVSIYIVALTVATLVSMYRFANINATVDFALFLCSVIGVGFLAVFYAGNTYLRDLLVRQTVLMVGALSLYGIAQYFVLYSATANILAAGGVHAGVENRVTSVLTSPNAFASLLVFVWPLALYVLYREEKPILRALYGINLAVILVAFGLTFSRAAYGVVLIQMAIATMFLWKRDRKLAFFMGGTGLAGLIVGGIYLLVGQKGSPTLASILSGASVSFAGRTSIWSTALKMIKANSFTGVGAGAFGSVYRAYQADGFFSTEAHNVYLQTFAELGVLGAVAFTGLAVYVVLKCCVSNKTVSTSKFIGFGAVGMMLANVFDSSIFVPLIAYTVALLTGISFARVDTPLIKHRDFPRNAFITGFIVLLIVEGFVNAAYYLAERGNELVYKGKEEGARYLELATVFNPVNAKYHSDLAQAYSAAVGSGAAARVKRISEARRASFLEPFNPEYYADLAYFYLDEDQPNLALYFLEQAVRVAPIQPYYRFALGDLYLNTGNTSAARAEFERCVSLERYFREPYVLQSYRPTGVPSYTDPLMAIARSYLRLGQIYLTDEEYDRSIAAFKKALAFNPQSSDALNGLATAYLRKGDSRKAEETIVRSLALDSAVAESWYLYGIALEQQGRVDDAIEAYTRAITIDPTFELAGRARDRLAGSKNGAGGKRQ